MRRFLIDAQLPPGLVSIFEAAGCQAEHVSRIGLGAASDEAVWAYATGTTATIVTKDADFRRLGTAMQIVVPVVWLRIGNATNAVLRVAVARAMPEILAALNDGEKFIELR